MKTVESRVNELESVLDTGPTSDLDWVLSQTSNRALLTLAYECFARNLFENGDISEVVERMERYAAGQEVELLSSESLASIKRARSSIGEQIDAIDPLIEDREEAVRQIVAGTPPPLIRKGERSIVMGPLGDSGVRHAADCLIEYLRRHDR